MPEALDDKRVAETFILRIDAYRTAMSNYVMLLKELELSVDQLMTAFVQPRSAVSIAAFAQRSGELLARAEAWRRAYSNLGAGGY